ncbi:MAG TPA: substrate-binding domain-containing protein [Anaerolineae bacterium]|nr:substrate-binding domain-containing protein [Anaerolineae bacterium]
MKKFTPVLLIITLLLTVFTIIGCSTNQKVEVKSSGSTENPVNKGTIILATTTSTQDTGLLDVLIPAFEKRTGITVKTIAVGTGEALKMGKRGDADVLLVHARQSEDEFMAKGFGKVRKDVMYNDFVLIGPKSDPAGIKEATSAAQAFRMIASKGAVFVSRGDDSGTHKKELTIWEKAGVKPIGAWYISTGQGMAATIRIANEKQGYTLSDRGTYLVQKNNIDLAIVLEKKKDLLNPYGVIAVNPDKFPKVNYKGAMEFVGFITAAEGQKIIRDFGKDKYGQALFTPDAKK